MKKNELSSAFITKELLKSKLSIKKKFNNYSYNQLFQIYEENSKIESSLSDFIVNLSLEAITDKHEIDVIKFQEHIADFWGVGVEPLSMKMTKAQVESMIIGAKKTDYIQFTFTDNKDDDFIHSIVQTHVFKSRVSCFPAVTFMKFVEDPKFDLLEIMKAKKHLNDPTQKFSMVVLRYTDTDKKVQYFDIVDNPTIDLSGLKS